MLSTAAFGRQPVRADLTQFDGASLSLPSDEAHGDGGKAEHEASHSIVRLQGDLIRHT